MSKINFYGFRDNIVGDFTFYCNQPNDEAMRRLVVDILHDKDHVVTVHRDDYSVYRLAKYNTEGESFFCFDKLFDVKEVFNSFISSSPENSVSSSVEVNA